MWHFPPGKGEKTILCSEFTLVNHSDERIVAQPLYCRAWSCEICQPRRQAQLVASAKRGLPDTFITLTSNPARYENAIERARALANAWRIIVKRIKRKYGYASLPYLCVFEATKKGEPHLHILARSKWIDQKWLSAQMAELTGAPIVDIRRITVGKAIAAYISKYVGKEPHRFARCKRYWSTRDYVITPRASEPDDLPENSTWFIFTYRLEQWTAERQREGHDVISRRGRSIIELRAPP